MSSNVLSESTEIETNFRKREKIRDLCARGLHPLNTFSGKYGLQQGQRILDRIVIYRILYANSITARVFCTGKVLVPIFYCPFLYFYQEPIVLRTDPLLYYFFYQVLKISIIPSQFFLIPGIFLRFTHYSRFFPVKKCSQIIPSLLRIPVG